jgi:hypothetical protein
MGTHPQHPVLGVRAHPDLLMAKKDSMINCPKCGKRVHTAGELVSYHPPCPVWEIKKERAWPTP